MNGRTTMIDAPETGMLADERLDNGTPRTRAASPTPDRPLRLLVVDHVALLAANRLRWRRLVEETGIVLTLVTPSRWIENCVPVTYQAEEGEPFRTIVGRPSWPGRELRSVYYSGLLRAFRESRPDAIVMMEESFSLFALQVVELARLFAPDAPITFYSFNITSYRRFPYRPDWFYQLVSSRVMRRCNVGFCVNTRAVEVLRDSTFQGRIERLFFGINDRLFRPIERGEARHRLGIPPDTFLFLYAGRLLEQKGVDDLIDAFDRLVAERPGEDLSLRITGDGEHAAALRSHAERTAAQGRISFHPAVPLEQVPLLMAAADAFVLPSRPEWHEQFGRVTAEAMLMGTTVVGSTSGEIPEAIGEGGFLFEAGEIDDLVAVMRRLLDDEAERALRRELGRRRALERYSVGGFVDGLIGVLEELCHRPLRRERQ